MPTLASILHNAHSMPRKNSRYLGSSMACAKARSPEKTQWVQELLAVC